MVGPVVLPSKSFTSQKLDLLHRILADRRVSDGQFRMFVRVLQAMNEKSGIAIIGDETIIAEVPSCGSPSTCKANRRRLEALGYWTLKPGFGARATEYRIDLAANLALVAGLKEQQLQRQRKRRQKNQKWRARKRADRHGNDGLPTHADRHADDGADRHVGDGQTDMQDPLYTFITPSTPTSSYRATEESRYLSELKPDFSGLKIPKNVLFRLGLGDVEEGRRLAELVSANDMANILDMASRFGSSACSLAIGEAREQALAASNRRGTS